MRWVRMERCSWINVRAPPPSLRRTAPHPDPPHSLRHAPMPVRRVFVLRVFSPHRDPVPPPPLPLLPSLPPQLLRNPCAAKEFGNPGKAASRAHSIVPRGSSVIGFPAHALRIHPAFLRHRILLPLRS